MTGNSWLKITRWVLYLPVPAAYATQDNVAARTRFSKKAGLHFRLLIRMPFVARMRSPRRTGNASMSLPQNATRFSHVTSFVMGSARQP